MRPRCCDRLRFAKVLTWCELLAFEGTAVSSQSLHFSDCRGTRPAPTPTCVLTRCTYPSFEVQVKSCARFCVCKSLAMPAEARAWLAPKDTTPSKPLTLYNSLLDEKVPFVPRGGPDSKAVTWYCCGPTVYDVAHIGHARNYVTFDIVRRVLEDYFGYNVTYIMNVTDVDDKIILRARRNHLVAQFLQQERQPAELLAICATASAESVRKQVRHAVLLGMRSVDRSVLIQGGTTRATSRARRK